MLAHIILSDSLIPIAFTSGVGTESILILSLAVHLDFNALRPRHINLEFGISDITADLVYHLFQDPAFNTFDAGIAATRKSPLLEKKRIQVCRLVDVLDQHIPNGKVIYFMSIDAEGFDLQVLRSNDWTRYRPSYVLVEALGMRDVQQVLESELHQYMTTHGYRLFAKSINTNIFVDSLVSCC